MLEMIALDLPYLTETKSIISRFDVSPIPTEQIEEFATYLREIRPPLFSGWVRKKFNGAAGFIEELYEQYGHVVRQRDQHRLWFHQALGELARRGAENWRGLPMMRERTIDA
jgi:hypothetical protein